MDEWEENKYDILSIIEKNVSSYYAIKKKYPNIIYDYECIKHKKIIKEYQENCFNHIKIFSDHLGITYDLLDALEFLFDVKIPFNLYKTKLHELLSFIDNYALTIK